MIGLDILHNVSVRHQFCNGGKIVGVDISQDAKEPQNVWVGQGIPENNFPTEPLTRTVQNPPQSGVSYLRSGSFPCRSPMKLAISSLLLRGSRILQV